MHPIAATLPNTFGFQHSSGVERSTDLEPFLDPDGGPPPYAELARRFGVNENTLHLHMRRLRQKFADLLREEVRQTVNSPEELIDEMNWFLVALRAA